jgi:hypothetical protein
MKTIIITGLVMSVIGGVLFFYPNTTAVQNIKEVIEVEREVTPDWATDEDAVKAAQDVIRKKELQAEEARLVGEITAKQEELDAVRKELGSY